MWDKIIYLTYSDDTFSSENNIILSFSSDIDCLKRVYS